MPVTGTYSKWADPIYRRAITPSSPVRGPLHKENDYPPGTILPRRIRDVKSTAWHEMPVSVDPASFHRCDPYHDSRDRSPHPRVQRQNFAFSESQPRLAYGYEMNFAASPAYLTQRTGPFYGEVPHPRDIPYSQRNDLYHRDLQSANQDELGSRERFVQYLPLPPNDFEAHSKMLDHSEATFSPQYYTNTYQVAQMPVDSERGISQFRNPNRNVAFDRGILSCGDFNMEPSDFEQLMPREHSLRSTNTDDMANRSAFRDYNDIIVDQNRDYQTPSDTAACGRLLAGNFVPHNDENFKRNDFRKRWVSDNSKFDLGLLRGNDDFGVDFQVDDVPKGIDRFKSKAQHEAKSDKKSDSSRRSEEGGMKGKSTLEKDQKVDVVPRVSGDAPSSNSKRPLIGVDTKEATTFQGVEEKIIESDSKRKRLGLNDCNRQKENVSPLGGDEPRLIGAALDVQFFNGGIEVDICGRPIDSKVQQPPANSSPDPLGNMSWNNEESLWG